MKQIYACIWQYDVKPAHIEDFEKTYNYNGDWAELFRNAEGYIKTDLLRDLKVQNQYITIDHWDSIDSFNKFREDFKDEYNRIDKICEEFTESEIKLGEYFY